ncbi:HAD family hydrolase [Paenibacillus sp. GCM10012307]|uniref:HAD family hydrolase n=1 Tax=Paenibacillus roseus TaxID=2798579 RepID=A0A934J2F5_9BACL|nr:HAD family hydrolase [Paenibacillus roseus]MBJ6360334.1 HAD family hydrolase [Paenibacillus roseus]
MQDIQAILFDLDNTLLDRSVTFRRFTNAFLATHLPHLNETEELADRIIDLDQDGYTDKRLLFSQLLEELPWGQKPELYELMEFYKSEYVRNAVLMDQAIEVLGQLRAKYKTGMITNGQTLIQYGKIDQLQLGSHFDTIIVSEEAGVKKPDAKIFELAMNRLNVKPENCIFVGDHPVNDIEGAAAVGMNAVWIQVNQPWREDVKAKPLHTIRKLTELLEVL